MIIKELREKALKLSNNAYDILKATEVSADQTVEAERMLAEADALDARANQMEKIEERQRAYEEAADRLPVEDASVEDRSRAVGEDRSEVFARYLRGQATGNELRAAGVGTDSAGGYLAPTSFVPTVIETMKAFGPMNDGGPITYLVTSNGNTLEMPTNDDTGNAGVLVAENAQIAEDDLVFGVKNLGAYKYTSKIFRVSNELLQDSAIDVASFVAKKAGERLGRIINQHLTVGTGSSQPEGIVTGASAGVTGSAAAAITVDDLIDLMHSVDPAYADNGAFMFNNNFVKTVRKLKDSTGQLIWQPAVTAGAPATILGKSFHVNQSMANIGASAVSALFGDFSKYTARRVQSVTVRRMNERYADYDQTAFVALVRYDGAVLDSAAIKKLTHPAS